MKSTQRFSIASSLLIVALMSAGCASDCGCSSGTGLFGTNILQGQPIRRTVGSWFQGDSCDSCNTPAGQLSQPYAEACPTCVGGNRSTGPPPSQASQVFRASLLHNQDQSLEGRRTALGQSMDRPLATSETSTPEIWARWQRRLRFRHSTPETFVSTFEDAEMRKFVSGFLS